jgi:hypothetical protein
MTRTAAARKADWINYRIRRHAIQSCYETYPSQSSRDRRIGLSEPIREVSIHDEELATSRFSMMRIMARCMNAATVLA